jgi:hypothetical protein
MNPAKIHPRLHIVLDDLARFENVEQRWWRWCATCTSVTSSHVNCVLEFLNISKLKLSSHLLVCWQSFHYQSSSRWTRIVGAHLLSRRSCIVVGRIRSQKVVRMSLQMNHSYNDLLKLQALTFLYLSLSLSFDAGFTKTFVANRIHLYHLFNSNILHLSVCLYIDNSKSMYISLNVLSFVVL